MNREMAVFISIGFELVGLLVGSAYLGMYLDEKSGTTGLWVGGLCVASLIVWLIHVLFMLNSFEKRRTETKK